MKIKICEANQTAIEAALKAVNGKAESFAITKYAHVAQVTRDLMARMEEDGLTLAEKAGASLWYRPSGPGANKYRYSATSTKIRIVVGSNGKDCFLTSVEPSGVNPKQAEYWMISLKPESKASWLARMGAKYGVLAE